MNRLQETLRPWHWVLFSLCLIWSKWLVYPPDVTFLWPSNLPVISNPRDAAGVNDIWQVPASQVPLLSTLQQIPLFFSACCFSLFFGSVVAQRNVVWALFAVILLCIIASPGQLTCAVFTGVVCQKFTFERKPRRVILMGWLTSIAAVFFSIDFGFAVLAFLFLIVFQVTGSQWKSSIWSMGVVTITLGSLLCATLLPGFLNAAMRPFLAIFVARQSDLFPQLEPVHAAQLGGVYLGGIILFLTCRIVLLFRYEEIAKSTNPVLKLSGANTNSLVVAFVFAVLAATSFYSLLPSLVALVCLPEAPWGSAINGKTNDYKSSRVTTMIIATPLIGFLAVLLMSELGWSTATGVQRQVDLSRSGISGNVLLLNPDNCEQWNQTRLSGEVTLIADSRWDRVGFDLRRYEDACRDIMAGREDIELRPNGSVGGYRAFMKQFDVTVISGSTEMRTTLRHLSTNPNWQLTAIDWRQAVFESPVTPAAKMRSRRMSQLLLHFEWPESGRSFDPEGILELGDLASARQVALALTAMHLPFASLRCVNADKSDQCVQVRQDAYLELATRMRDQCGCDSLADLWRALQPVAATAGLDFIRGTSSPLWSESEDLPDSDTPEGRLRASLANGDLPTSLSCLREIPDQAIRNYYQELIRLSPLPGQPDDVVLDATALPERLRDEGLMIMANLALERGDAPKTVQLLADSLRAFPDSKFTALRSFYLQQLTR